MIELEASPQCASHNQVAFTDCPDLLWDANPLLHKLQKSKQFLLSKSCYVYIEYKESLSYDYN